MDLVSADLRSDAVVDPGSAADLVTPTPTPTPTELLIARMWERFRPLAEERVQTIDAYVRTGTAARLASVPTPRSADAVDECESARARARQAAHDLAGSLGSYGRPNGSELARRVEELLLADDGSAPALRILVEALRSEVTR